MSYEKSPHWQSGIAILEDNVFERQFLPQESAISERRKSSRFNVTVPLTYRIQDKPSSSWNLVESQDVSNTGVRLHMQESPPLGTILELDVALPGTERKILIEGTVIWTRPSHDNETMIECGVAFQNLKRVSGKEKLLKFITDKLCLFALKNPPKNLTCTPADNLQDLLAAYHLIYEEYIKRGYCHPNASQLHFSLYCFLPDARTFLLKRDRLLLGTLTLIPDSDCGIPMENVFPEMTQSLRKEGRRIAEVSLLALNSEAFHRKSFSLTDFQKLTGTFHLFKILFDHVRLKTSITDLVIAVNPKHEDLYRYLTFQKLGASRSYAGACGKPALAMRLSIENAGSEKNVSLGLIRYFYNKPASDEILLKKFEWDVPNLEEMLLRKSNLWHELPEKYKSYLKSIYPKFQPK